MRPGIGAGCGDGVQPGDRVGAQVDVVVAAVEMLLRAGADDASLRADVQADDVVSSLIGIFLASGSPEQTGRMLDLLVAGVAR